MTERVSLSSSVIERAVETIPDDITQTLKQCGRSAVIGGGFLRTVGTQVLPCRQRTTPETAPKDLDVFVSSPAARDEICAALRESGRDWVSYYSPFHDAAWRGTTTFHARGKGDLPIQIVGEWPHADPADLLDVFDLGVNQVVMWWNGETWEGEAIEGWDNCISERVARYNRSAPNPAGTLLRVTRYVQLGFYLSSWCMMDIAARAAEQAGAFAREQSRGRNWSIAEALHELSWAMASPPVDAYADEWEVSFRKPHQGRASYPFDGEEPVTQPALSRDEAIRQDSAKDEIAALVAGFLAADDPGAGSAGPRG